MNLESIEKEIALDLGVDWLDEDLDTLLRLPYRAFLSSNIELSELQSFLKSSLEVCKRFCFYRLRNEKGFYLGNGFLFLNAIFLLCRIKGYEVLRKALVELRIPEVDKMIDDIFLFDIYEE
ncbi:hypothetical protein [Roseivirga pacifica]|uniref:hypothetical protein n=1 Tax=Roseivirga pacifica TaxID=1267423 RepID=UPI003BB16005